MKETNKKIITAIAIVLVLGTIFYLEQKKPKQPQVSGSNQDIQVSENTMNKEEKVKKYEVAKEISSPDGFINTDNITIAEHIGKDVILVDFWTYSCINCQRTLPHLNSWQEKYGDKGLVIIGVHTPEFDFEKEYGNVKRAVEKFGVTYPVVLDNDYSTWTSYKNRYWPRKYLIDIDGFIVYDHIGEGGYDETEDKIVELLNERSERLGMGDITRDMSAPEGVDEVNFAKVKSPETYLGSARIQYLANLPAQDCLGRICEFTAPEKVSLNTYVLGGSWEIKEEEATLKSDTGSIIIRFSANKVNFVGGSSGEETRAEIYLDGKLVEQKNAGEDVREGSVSFGAHQLYNLIDLKGDYGEHTLEIRILKGGVSGFAFTFG